MSVSPATSQKPTCFSKTDAPAFRASRGLGGRPRAVPERLVRAASETVELAPPAPLRHPEAEPEDRPICLHPLLLAISAWNEGAAMLGNRLVPPHLQLKLWPGRAPTIGRRRNERW